jgi:hypothetical protein
MLFRGADAGREQLEDDEGHSPGEGRSGSMVSTGVVLLRKVFLRQRGMQETAVQRLHRCTFEALARMGE